MPRYAAVDIGSNSVRLLVADGTIENGAPLIARLVESRQVTRLGQAVFESGAISPDAMDSVCAVLREMKTAWQKLEASGVRAVATSATRDASNQAEFIARASDAIGVPVETISGVEEARLIHLGVEAVWPHPKQRILIVDVGGGSAEFIAAESGQWRDGYSRPLGAVRLKEVFLRSDPPAADELLKMEEFIDEKLAAPLAKLGGKKYARVIATSASAAATVCAVNKIERAKRDTADRMSATVVQIRKLYREFAAMTTADRRKVTGIGPRRAEIIVAGASVLLKTLERFGLTELHYSLAGVRDGIIADLALRGAGQEFLTLSADQRRAVEEMAERYGVALPHARAVSAHARTLFVATAPIHQLPASACRLLEAACFLRDVGHFVSDMGHHKHSHYIVRNSDLAGFTDQERTFISLLCRYHRKAMPAPRHGEFQLLNAEQKRTLMYLVPLLRIADALDRSREQVVEEIRLQLQNGFFELALTASSDASLERWAVGAAADNFRAVYGRELKLRS
jgi:exopolyphosphatase/guanosine-5'-triphosphate,3'-diphosphate pyrophosphatase